MTIFLALALQAAPQIAAPPSEPVVPAFFSGERLYEICRRRNNGQCSMYVAGVIDGLFLSESETSSESLCRAKLNNREAAKIVTTYLAEHPAYLQSAAALAVRVAVRDTLACDDHS